MVPREIANVCWTAETFPTFLDFFSVCLFPMILPFFSQKSTFFHYNVLKCVGNRQTQFFLQKLESLIYGDVFLYPRSYHISKLHIFIHIKKNFFKKICFWSYQLQIINVTLSGSRQIITKMSQMDTNLSGDTSGYPQHACII